MVTLNLSPELQKELQNLAEADQRSLEDVAEDALIRYIGERKSDNYLQPSPEEIAAVKETIANMQKPGAVDYSNEEVEADMEEWFNNYQPKNQQSN